MENTSICPIRNCAKGISNHIECVEMNMEFKFNNYSRHVESRGKYKWFEWKVFMDEPAEKLDKVRNVEYRLHETFPNPICIIEDRNSQFALRSAGWGEFWIFITIYLEDGTEEHTRYYLNLGKPWPPDEH